jgi:hypothetical protein
MANNVISIDSIRGEKNYTTTKFPKCSWLAELKFKAKVVMGRLLSKLGLPGFIKPVEHFDEYTGQHIQITTSAYFTKLSINGRDYFFHRLSGRFDGTGSGCS